MRCVFLVQGEGRGHLTQAITLSNILKTEGHSVEAVLVGKKDGKKVVDFFYKKIKADVITYKSPCFVWNKSKTKINLFQTILASINPDNLRDYYKSMQVIYKIVEEREIDLIINFYEPLSGLTALLFNLKTPIISIAHQYLIFHNDYKYFKIKSISDLFYKLNTYITSYRSVKRLGISFNEFDDDIRKKIFVMPPLIRKEVMLLKPERKNYILVYVMAEGYVEDIIAWNKSNPSETLHVFCDISQNEIKISPTLTLHKINDTEFLSYLANCKAYITTAGFESVCEAKYLGKDVMMVPIHSEQRINAKEACDLEFGISSEGFVINKLLSSLSITTKTDSSFKEWVDSAQERYLYEISSEIYKTKPILSFLNRGNIYFKGLKLNF